MSNPNTMAYKGYIARIEYHPEDHALVGKVLGIEDSITFHGESVVELEDDFHKAINHYLADCEQQGRKPQKPYSGNVMLRLPPEVHAAAAIAAQASGKSLNQWAAETLERAAVRA